jgi:hypothetical protein
MGSPILLTFYDPETDDEKKTYIRAFVPSKMLKAVFVVYKRLGKTDLNDPENIEPEIVDEIMGLIVEFYGRQFSIDELGDYTKPDEMMACFMAIANRAQGIFPNPPPPGN